MTSSKNPSDDDPSKCIKPFSHPYFFLKTRKKRLFMGWRAALFIKAVMLTKFHGRPRIPDRSSVFWDDPAQHFLFGGAVIVEIGYIVRSGITRGFSSIGVEPQFIPVGDPDALYLEKIRVCTGGYPE